MPASQPWGFMHVVIQRSRTLYGIVRTVSTVATGNPGIFVVGNEACPSDHFSALPYHLRCTAPELAFSVDLAG